MITNVSATNTAQPPAPSKSVNGKLAQKVPQQAPTDNVQISSAGQSALKEASETLAQTTKEAMSGDIQAKRLLAIEAARKAAGI